MYDVQEVCWYVKIASDKDFLDVYEYHDKSYLILTSKTNDSKDVFTFDHILLCFISP